MRNSGYLKAVLYSELQSILIENVIILTLVIQRRAEQISTTRSRTCTRRKIAISFGLYFTSGAQYIRSEIELFVCDPLLVTTAQETGFTYTRSSLTFDHGEA